MHFEHPHVAALCGAVVTAAQLTAGVSGPLLDIFFVKGRLDRHRVIGTKALTQSLGHLIKLIYFGGLVAAPTAGDTVPLVVYPISVGCAVAGTTLGKQILGRVSDAQFRRWSTGIVFVLGAALVVQGLQALLARGG